MALYRLDYYYYYYYYYYYIIIITIIILTVARNAVPNINAEKHHEAPVACASLTSSSYLQCSSPLFKFQESSRDRGQLKMSAQRNES